MCLVSMLPHNDDHYIFEVNVTAAFLAVTDPALLVVKVTVNAWSSFPV